MRKHSAMVQHFVFDAFQFLFAVVVIRCCALGKIKIAVYFVMLVRVVFAAAGTDAAMPRVSNLLQRAMLKCATDGPGVHVCVL